MIGDYRHDVLWDAVHFTLRKPDKLNVVILQPVFSLSEVGTIHVFVILNFRGDPSALVL
jgi:hypothetical protein